MKGMDIFCATPAAISCLSMDEPSSSSSSTIHLGGSGRAIDRYNPIIRDPKRFGSSRTTLPNFIPASCSSQPPISPKPLSQPHHHHNHKNHGTVTKNSSKPSNEKSHNSNNTNKKKKIKVNNKSSPAIKPPQPSDQEKRKSSCSITTTATVPHDQPNDFPSSTSAITSSFADRKSWSCSSKAAAGDFISPPASSRCLLSTDQAAFFNLISEDSDPVVKLLPPVVEAEPPYYSKSNSNCNNNKALQKDDQSKRAFNKPISSSSSGSPNQVVVLRVSLHCKGCERKMRKHISRMEDFAAKKVTVVGNVTPLGVLASISKVKNAQLWAPAAAAAVSSSNHANSSEINQKS